MKINLHPSPLDNEILLRTPTADLSVRQIAEKLSRFTIQGGYRNIPWGNCEQELLQRLLTEQLPEDLAGLRVLQKRRKLVKHHSELLRTEHTSVTIISPNFIRWLRERVLKLTTADFWYELTKRQSCDLRHVREWQSGTRRYPSFADMWTIWNLWEEARDREGGGRYKMPQIIREVDNKEILNGR